MRFLSVPGPRDVLALLDRSGDVVEQIIGTLPRIVPLVEGAQRVVTEAEGIFRRIEETRQAAASVVARIQTTATRVDSVVDGAEATAARVDALVEGVDAIAGRVDQVTERVDLIAGRVDALVALAGAVVGRGDAVVEGADTVLGRVDTVAGQVEGVVGRAREAVADADTVVGKVDALSRRVNDLMGELEPSLRTLEPTLDRLAQTMGAREVAALAMFLDQIPRLFADYEGEVLPVITTLRSVSPDIHDLLDTSRELNELLVKVPGMGRIKKKVEEEQSEPDA